MIEDDRWWWVWSSRWNENWQGKPEYSAKTWPNATLCTTNPTCPDLGSNLDRRSGKPATLTAWVLSRPRVYVYQCPGWLWGCSPRQISSPGPVFYGTKWLLWRPHRQGPTLHSRCGINKGLIKRGSTIDLQRSRCKGWFLWFTPYTYIHTCVSVYFYPGNYIKSEGRFVVLHCGHL
jgi:hypothetical protein